MAFSFLVTLREGIEMALVIAILLGYLRSIGQKQHFRAIWTGVGVAAAICLAIGIGLEIASKELDKRIVEGFEGFAMIFAVIVLTGMAFWMKRQAAGMSAELRARIDSALGGGSVTALVLLAATSVGREGLETTLFLFAGSSTGASGTEYVLGGVLGFAVAAVVGVGIYQGSRWFPMRAFFQVSAIVLIVLAAGLLANSVTKLYEAALISNLGTRPWDTDGVVSMTSDFGKFLNTLVGYDSAPAMLQIVLYWGYLLTASAAYLWLPVRRPASPVPVAPATNAH
ncbi:MAG: FTR1 family protein [Dehalococcoidia bacterium]|nr:FTR1 family protein [Dehalococcoidia bacterium]